MRNMFSKRVNKRISRACLIESLENRQLLAADLLVTPTANKTAILNALLGGNTGVKVTSVAVKSQKSGNALSIGTYTNPGAVFGIGNGIIMSSGDVAEYSAPTPNTGAGSDENYATDATAAQEALLSPISANLTKHYDVTEVDITFNMPATLGSVFFNVVFGSEEYPTYVGTSFKDAFGLYLNGVNIAKVANQPVNIDHPAFVASTTNELNGLLSPNGNPLLQFSGFVGPGSKNNTLTFILADTSDHALATTAYISALGAKPPNPNIPTAIVSAPVVGTNQADETFTVTYTAKGSSLISLATIDNNDLVVTGPDGYSQAAAFISADQTADAASIVATYKVTGPSTAPFTVANDGTYTISMNFEQVSDAAGNFVTEGGLGTFNVNIVGVTLAAPSTYLAGTANYFFDVTYTDPNKLNLKTIDSKDILVTGPNGFSKLAKKFTVTGNDLAKVTVTYILNGAGTKWAASDAGSYTFALQANQVVDLKKQAVAGQTMGTVALTPFGGLTNPAAAELPSTVGATAVATGLLGRTYIAFYDTVDQDLKVLVRAKNGKLTGLQTIDSTVGAGTQLAMAVQKGIPYIAYYESTSQTLKLATLAKGSWKLTTVDTATGVGQHPSITFNSAGQPVISYYDATNADLKVAVRTSATAFTVTTVDSAGDVGSFSSIALNPATGSLGVLYTDTTNNTIKFATESSGTFTPSTVPNTVAAQQELSLVYNNAGTAFAGYFNPTASGGPEVDVQQFITAWSSAEVFKLAGSSSVARSLKLLMPANATLPQAVFVDSGDTSLKVGQHTTTADVTSTIFNNAGSNIAVTFGLKDQLDILVDTADSSGSLLLLPTFA